jgi:probable HAF family extracellular repeat protein
METKSGGEEMKSRKLSCMIAMTLFTAAFPVQVAAQEQSDNPQHERVHPRYRFVDLGTLGGPAAYFIEFEQVLTNRGALIGGAHTTVPDPNRPNCFNPADCFVSHAFLWREETLTDLGALPGVNSSIPSQINKHGNVVGTSQNGLIDPLTGSPESRAVLWHEAEIADLGTLGGNESGADGINNRDQIIGVALNAIPDPFSFVGGTQTRAFLWQDGVMQDLGTLGGPDAFAQYVNDRGQVTGFSYTSNKPTSSGVPQIDPFFWDNGMATMQDLGSLGGTVGQVNDLNNRGQVIGTMNLAGDAFQHGFLWDKGVLTDLGTFGGNNSQANWITEAGDIVGKADLPGSNAHNAFLWRKGVMTNLGTLYNDPCSNATGINSRGQVVGTSDTPDCTVGLHAFLWENGSMTDLNTFLPPGASLQQLTVAFYINDRGEIGGIGVPPGVSIQDQFNLGHVFVLIPCDAAHSDEKGCEDGADMTNVARSVPFVQSSTTAAQSSVTTSEMPARIYNRFGRNRDFASWLPK